MNLQKEGYTSVAALHKDGKVKHLKEKEMPWGLVSVALGNKNNRDHFCDTFFFSPERKEEDKQQRIQNGEYLTIWQWKYQYNGPTFHEAQTIFKEADKKVADYIAKLKQYETLFNQVGNITIEEYCKEFSVKIDAAIKKISIIENKIKDLQLDHDEILKNKQNIQNAIKDIDSQKPSIWERLFRTQCAKDYTRQRNKFRTKLFKCIDDKNALNNKIEEHNRTKRKQKKYIEKFKLKEQKSKEEYTRLLGQYETLKEKLANVRTPPHNLNLENDAVQLTAFWQNEHLNELRTHLFISALKLHEAWLAEVMQNRDFNQNILAISDLLKGKRLIDKSNAIHIWQSLFMFLPVISSTFASVARQFSHVENNQLGWVFIDEAGQAIPQAAVGTISRAQQVIVVGDPLQIEPVFTTPPALIETLGKRYLNDVIFNYCPTKVSVQNIADAVNPWGVNIHLQGKNTWIGSPLRVHRRCLDPMFSVANQIAYGNKMINARVDKVQQEHPLGDSGWFDIQGLTTEKQYVPDQGELLLELFTKCYIHEGNLPEIFIISPFKQVRISLRKLIRNSEKWIYLLPEGMNLPSQYVLTKWCRNNIGTVHTFQGKEEASVIFVLGADKNTTGSVNWAASKPNILNVALTRAKNRFYVIGDYELWSNKNYFCVLAGQLTKKAVKFQLENI